MLYESSYGCLTNFIKNHSDWRELLKPYMKSYNTVDFNKNWLVLMYCLFDIPKDPELFEIIKRCRGSIVDITTGEVVCAPFIKFWNLGEGYADKIDWSTAKITHKRDGWIFKAFKYNGKVYFASNGKTISRYDPPAPVDKIAGLPELRNMADVLSRAWFLGCGEDLVYDNDGHLTVKNSWLDKLEDNCTLCFELESPWNRIHTDLVEDAKLWLIMYRGSDGKELDVWSNVKECPFDRPAVYTWHTEKEMLDTMKQWTAKENGEGVVVMDSEFHRVKVKSEDYCRIKFESSTSGYGDNRLFKYFINGEIDDLVAMNPDLLPRVEIMQNKMTKLDQLLLKHKKNSASYKDMSDIDYYRNIVGKATGWDKYFLARERKYSVEQIKQELVDKWKTKSNGFSDLCEIVD